MDSSTLRLDWLRGFVIFASELNFTRAAAALHLSQPALHTQIGQLGEWAGSPLYYKSGRRLVLTDTGREVEALGRVVLGEIEAFSARQAAPIVPVLSAGRATLQFVLAEALRSFGGPLSLRAEDQPACLESVRTGRAALAVCPLWEQTELLATPLIRFGQVVLVPRGDPLAGRRRVKLSDLAGRAMVVPPVGRPHRTTLSTLLGADLRVAVEVDGWETITLYASLGLGLAVVNAYVPTPAGMVAVPVPELPSIVLHLLSRPGRRPLPLAEHLRGVLGRGAASAPG